MNIVMDFRKYDGVVGGVEQVVTQIVGHVSSEGHRVILLSKNNRINQVKELFKDQSNVKHSALPVGSHAISLKNAWLDSVTIQNIARREDAPVVHFPYNWSFPFFKRVKTVLTIHDVIPFTFREAMGYFRNRFLYRPALKTACRLNSVITTISEFSRRDLAQKTGVDENMIKVIPNGFRIPHQPTEKMKTELCKRFQLQEGFVLNVGGIHERKNIIRLIEAFSGLVKQTQYPGKLVITGSVSGAVYQEKMKKLCDRAVSETGMNDKVVFTGFVSDEELDNLMNLAGILIYPSLYEGFGIPILEAMNVHLPVITSNITAMKEVAADAALLVDPYNIEEMTAAMSKLLSDKELRLELCKKGKTRAGAYSWEKLAKEYLQLYRQLAQNNQPGYSLEF